MEDSSQSPIVSSTSTSSSTLSTSSVLKKTIPKVTSPLKHVTPIIKKYDYQRQAKNGKSVKKKSQGKVLEEDSTGSTPTPVHDLAAGMNSLDAALRCAEKCIASSKDPDSQADFSLDQGLESNTDDLGDIEEEGIPSSITSSSHQNAASNKSAHLRNRNRVLKKRNQLQKDLENALPLVVPDQCTMTSDKAMVFAASYIGKIRERYDSGPQFSKFMELVNELDRTQSVTDLYHRVINLFEEQPDLGEEFLLFLLPKQAIQCGKFMEHLALTEMSSFLRKLEVCFAKQPQQLRKVQASIVRLIETPDITLETVRSTILPLLRGNSYLVESFLGLLPSEQPPESKITDFDLVRCEDMDGEYSGEEETFERVEIPPENDDPFGGEHCQCCCHDSNDPTFSNRTKHCRGCGIKFIAGKIFMQTDHGLRPVRIDFPGGSMSSHIKRLKGDHPKLSRTRSRRGRLSQMASKPDDGKQGAETDDEAAFTKVKSPRQRPKISKPPGEKTTTPKSLSLNRVGCPRKPVNAKMGSSPPLLINDQEAMAVPLSSEEDKPPVLEFPMFSNMLLTSEDKDTREEQGSNKNNGTAEQSTHAPAMEVEEDVVKQEDIPDDVSNCDIVMENITTKLINIENEKEGEKEDVKIEEDAPQDVAISETDEGTEDNVKISGANFSCDNEVESKDDAEGAIWTRDEDRIILCTFQSEPDKMKTLTKISSQLPHRTLDEISSRFQILMSLIQQMQ
ncbi:GON-4-like protein [Thrips palmi]|uniref:GON-4-like protein n=1 Tax=Thrips palmi TaxID=161013 RepID=A0A6P8Y825_THRPL|nr:GON-4-like protein [Thrips palmi]XP_034235783.1 GON-4-like protein [Thrips palmi]